MKTIIITTFVLFACLSCTKTNISGDSRKSKISETESKISQSETSALIGENDDDKKKYNPLTC